MNLRWRLQRRTLIVAAATSAVLAAALAFWTVQDTRREIEATRALVRATVGAVLQAQAGAGGAGGAGGGGGVASAGPSTKGSPAAIDSASGLAAIRHVTIGLNDAHDRSGAPGAGWLERLIDTRVERIAVTPGGAGDPTAPALLVGANAHSEFYEHMIFAAAAFGGLAVFGLTVAAIQYRTLLHAFSPVETFKQRLRDFENGNLSSRLPEPELDELSAIARSFNRLADSLQQTVEEQQRLSRALLSLRSEERQRLARELHDDLGQAVTALSVDLAVVRRSLDAQPSAIGGIDRLERDVEALRAATRGLLADLRDDQAADGLARLDPQCIVAEWQRNRPDVDWRLDGPWADMLGQLHLPEYGTACRVLQESLTNAFRHAEPSQIVVAFRAAPVSQSGRGWSLVVENDGVRDRPANGAWAANVAGPARSAGLGLQGMRERAASIGAQLQAAPSGEKRWRVSLQMPELDPGRAEQGVRA